MKSRCFTLKPSRDRTWTDNHLSSTAEMRPPPRLWAPMAASASWSFAGSTRPATWTSSPIPSTRTDALSRLGRVVVRGAYFRSSWVNERWLTKMSILQATVVVNVCSVCSIVFLLFYHMHFTIALINFYALRGWLTNWNHVRLSIYP